jgi:DNA-binding GntR family transcriptional regulator
VARIRAEGGIRVVENDLAAGDSEARAPIELQEPLVQRRLSDVIYDALLEAVVSASLEPGQMLHDWELARNLSVSRTPVREALQRLTEIGMVEIAPGRYTRVTPIDPAHVADVCRLGGQALALAIELATPQLTAEHIRHLERENVALLGAITSGDGRQIERSVWAFYEVFTTVAERPVYSEAVARLAPHVARWARTHRDWKVLPTLAARRAEVLAAVKARDGASAAELIRRLWNDVADTIQ